MQRDPWLEHDTEEYVWQADQQIDDTDDTKGYGGFFEFGGVALVTS